MKTLFAICTTAALLLSGAAFAQDSIEQNDINAEQPVAIEQNADASQTVEPGADAVEPDAAVVESGADAVEPESAPVSDAVIQTEPPASEEISQETPAVDASKWVGFWFYGGIGPAFDLHDPAYGYSARVGLDIHHTYFGFGFEVSWNMIWAANGTKRSDHNDTAYRATNSAFLLMGHGYIPATDHLVILLGAGIGLGKRYEKIFSDYNKKNSDASWLARLQAGVVWLCDNKMTFGFDAEFNFGNYLYKDKNWWSDEVEDVSLGLVFTVGYQLQVNSPD